MQHHTATEALDQCSEMQCTAFQIARAAYPKTKPAPTISTTPGRYKETTVQYSPMKASQPFQSFCFANHLSMSGMMLRPCTAVICGGLAAAPEAC